MKISDMLKDDIVVKLIGYLIDNNLRPGDKLPSIREFSALWNCNPSRIRTGLITLAALGIVDTHSRAGSFVKQLSSGDMDTLFNLFFRLGMLRKDTETIHIYEAKTLMDREVFSHAALYRTDRDLYELDEILKKQAACQEDPHAFIDWDEAFHLRLAQILRNPVVQLLLESLQSMLRSYRKANLTLEECRDSYKDHCRIYEAIRAKNPLEAEEIAKMHSRNRKQVLLAKESAAKAG